MTQSLVRVYSFIACLFLLPHVICAQEKKPPAPVPPKPKPKPSVPKVVPSKVPEVSVSLNLSHPSVKSQRDMCVWVHPKHDFLSTIITCDRTVGKVLVYDINGKVLDAHNVKNPGSIDIRYGYPLGGKLVDIIVCNQTTTAPRLRVFAVDDKTRKLTRVDNDKMYTGNTVGTCMYRSRKTGKFYAFVANLKGEIKQYEIAYAGKGKVKLANKIAAQHKVTGACESMVADDEKGWVFTAETNTGIWLHSAEPAVKFKARRVAAVGRNELKAGVYGMAIYHGRDGKGYFLVASGGNNQISVHDRKTFKYLGGFRLRLAENVVGIDVCNVPVGDRFAKGLFVCAAQAKGKRLGVFVAPWDKVAKVFDPPLVSRSRYNPRRLRPADEDDEPPKKPSRPRDPKKKPSKTKPSSK